MMFPREIYIYSRDELATCVSWDRSLGYKVLLDDDTTAYLNQKDFTLTSELGEPLLEVKNGVISEAAPCKERLGRPEAPTKRERARESTREATAGFSTPEDLAEWAAPLLGVTPESLLIQYAHLRYSNFKMAVCNRVVGILSR